MKDLGYISFAVVAVALIVGCAHQPTAERTEDYRDFRSLSLVVEQSPDQTFTEFEELGRELRIRLEEDFSVFQGIAGPGEEFNQTCVMDPRYPSAQFAFAGSIEDYFFISHRQGGFAPFQSLIVYRRQDDRFRHERMFIVPWMAEDFSAIRKAALDGAFRDLGTNQPTNR